MTARIHGGADAQGRAPLDLSTGSHPAGPLPLALELVLQADPSAYPDPGYTALKAALAQRHGVDAARILIAASASEFIQRITAVSARLQPGAVAVPQPGYGDYAAAAQAWGRAVGGDKPSLRWCAEPGSPDGRPTAPPADLAELPTVLDLAYEPLRLQGGSAWTAAARAQVFQLITPNKALGLCGVRGAYAIAPAHSPWPEALQAAEPSWALGAQGLALLQAWCSDAVQQQLTDSLPVVRSWRAALVSGLQARGFAVAAGVTPFVTATGRLDAAALRRAGVAVRDLTSFGLPGSWRINSAAPADLAALWKALDS